MAVVTDPEVLKFNNEAFRVIAETLSKASQTLNTAKTDYTTNILPKLNALNVADTVQDREAEGLTTLTVQELKDMGSQINSVLTAIDAAGAAALRSKFHVRDLL